MGRVFEVYGEWGQHFFELINGSLKIFNIPTSYLSANGVTRPVTGSHISALDSGSKTELT